MGSRAEKSVHQKGASEEETVWQKGKLLNYLVGEAFIFSWLAELDIGVAELDQADDQQHQGHAGHAQEVRPVDAEEDRVAVQVEDREIHEPDRHRNSPLEQFLHI